MAGVGGLLCRCPGIPARMADNLLSGADAVLPAARHRHPAHRAAIAAEQGRGLRRLSATHQRVRALVPETPLAPACCAGWRPRLGYRRVRCYPAAAARSDPQTLSSRGRPGARSAAAATGAWRVPGDHGRIRLRQVDAAEPD